MFLESGPLNKLQVLMTKGLHVHEQGSYFHGKGLYVDGQWSYVDEYVYRLVNMLTNMCM